MLDVLFETKCKHSAHFVITPNGMCGTSLDDVIYTHAGQCHPSCLTPSELGLVSWLSTPVYLGGLT